MGGIHQDGTWEQLTPEQQREIDPVAYAEQHPPDAGDVERAHHQSGDECDPWCPATFPHHTTAEPDAGDVEALVGDCLVFRGGVRCTEMIGADFPNGAKWTEEMCCLPCRVRAALPARLDAARAAERERIAGPLTDDEANRVDFALGEHAYHHSINNNIGGMGCDVECRTRALKRAVDKVLAARIAGES